MESKKTVKKAARAAASLLKGVLFSSANSTSCIVVHQPKAPEALKQFSRVK